MDVGPGELRGCVFGSLARGARDFTPRCDSSPTSWPTGKGSVVGSRIGGVPFTVLDGATGLLCEPGNAEDLACKLEKLLDDAALRTRMGSEGRRRFEEEFTWERVIEKHYRPLLVKK